MDEVYRVIKEININGLFSLFEKHYDKGYSFHGETHNFWECLYVIHGNVCVSGDDRIYNLSEGDIIFHKPMELHKFHVDDENGVDLLIFSFFADGELIPFFERKVFKLNDEQNHIINLFLSYIRTQWSLWSDKDCEFRMYMKGFNSSKTYSHTVATYITHLLLMLYDDNDRATVLYTPETVAFKNAVDYMNGHISENPSISDIASNSNVSASTLKRIFSKYSGLSIHKYFTTLKMKTAMELLKSGASVSEVSDKLGFANPSYFSAAFKRETGYRPAQIKRQMTSAAQTLT